MTKEQAIDELTRCVELCPTTPLAEACRMAVTAVEKVEAVDAVKVRHGRWKEDPSGYGFWICSACGFVSEASAANMLYKFCPVCGADMRKDGEHHD